MPKENKDMKKTPNSLIILVAFSLLLSGCNQPASSSNPVSDSSNSTSSVAALNTYTVTWKNYDGTLLEVDENVLEGTTPTFNGPTPMRAETAQYNYVFDGWSPALTAVNANAEYTAKYKEETRKYTVTWKNYDGTVLSTEEVLYGTVPTYQGDTPTRGDTVEHTYTFDGWSPKVEEVKETISYVASFKENKRNYNITWKDEDGTILRVDQVPYGDTPNYGDNTPIKENTAQYAYAFDKWVPAIASVTGDMEYTASYNSEVRKYKITWVNEDGSVLEVDENVPYGDTPHYNGATPTKKGDRGIRYNFKGWDPIVESVQGDKTYTATYNKEGYFSFDPINYEMEHGYQMSDINGAPWIDSNIDGEINKIKQPSVKDDFFTSVNYERIKENTGSAFTAAQYAVRDIFSDMYYDPTIATTTTNGVAFQTVAEKIINSDAESIGTYLNSINLEQYLNSKECFASRSSVLSIEPYEDTVVIYFNDGYVSSNYDTLPFLFEYQSTRQYGAAILSYLSEYLGLGFTNEDINRIYSFDYNIMYQLYMDYSYYGTSLISYTVGDLPWQPMKNALLDLGFTAKQKVYTYKMCMNCYDIYYDNYCTEVPNYVRNDIISRLAFDYRYFIGMDNYKTINQYLTAMSTFFSNEAGLYAENDATVVRTLSQICMPIVTQQTYIELAGSDENRDAVTDLINEILAAYKEMAKDTWLGEETKKAMIKKLEYMGYASCYSDAYKNFAKFVDDNTPNKSAFEIFRAYTINEINEIARGNGDEVGYFLSIPCYTVNAFYSPRSNDIIILDGLAQGMLGDSIEEKYALLGTIVGHEITHAFDTDGSLYDENGEENNWWTKKDRDVFEAKVDKLINFYDQISLKKGYKVDGTNVSQEATADLGGMKIILEIVKKYDNFDYDKFFRAYAYLWCCKTFDISLVEPYEREDGHPFNYLRANVTLAQFDEFVETYDIKPGDGMYIPEEQRIKIW